MPLNNNVLGGQCHWITISNVGCPQSCIEVYDSRHQAPPSATKRVIADLMMSKDSAISIHFVPVKWQSGCDCGIFALVFATSLCTGHDPASILHEQTCMRWHLLDCLSKRIITPFSQKSQQRKTRMKKVHTDLMPIYCLCRLPDDGTRMVQCDQCGVVPHSLYSLTN